MKRRLGILDPLRVEIYGGYAGPAGSVVWGRALEDEVPSAPRPDDSTLENIVRALKQFESDEVPGVGLRVRAGEHSLDLTTDDEGFFCAELPALREEKRSSQSDWLEVSAEVVSAPAGAKLAEPARGEVLAPEKVSRVIVSDIDDTILQSHVQNKLKQAWVTLAHNSLRRKTYPGTTRLYRGIQAAAGDAPCVYLSRSAWNIHALLERFIAEQKLPRGPLVLRDVGLWNDPEKRAGHKRRELDRLLRCFPEAKLVCIGDSGQADAEIYMDVALAYPGRVEAILIRNVSRSAEQVGQRLRQRAPDETRTLLFEDADQAASVCHGWGLWTQPTAVEAN